MSVSPRIKRSTLSATTAQRTGGRVASIQVRYDKCKAEQQWRKALYKFMFELSITDNSKRPRCRLCGDPLRRTFVDLGMSPLCECYLSVEKLNQMEPFYPLHVFVCEQCYLVQLLEYVAPEDIFTDYAYFSSVSDSWLQHVKEYVDMVTDRLKLGPESLVVELASNDGYLLQYFVQKSIPVLGIDPAANVAQAAIQKGVPTLVRFFGEKTAREVVAEGKQADLLLGNNVLAHVPGLNDFVGG